MIKKLRGELKNSFQAETIGQSDRQTRTNANKIVIAPPLQALYICKLAKRIMS